MHKAAVSDADALAERMQTAHPRHVPRFGGETPSPMSEVLDATRAILTSGWKLNKANVIIHKGLWILQKTEQRHCEKMTLKLRAEIRLEADR